MPRKSARLRSKSKLPLQSTESDEFLHKRRRMADGDQGDVNVGGRRQQFRIQNNRLPISQTDAITSSMIVPSDEVDHLVCPEQALSGSGWVVEEEEDIVHVVTNPPRQRQLFRFSNHFQDEIERLMSFNPLPDMDWADSEEVWDSMKAKEEKYLHSMNIFLQHPDVKPNMRAVLLTWLTEVCEVYKLHKETYYMAMDFIDRFLLATNGMKTSQLQLLGVTALFVAAKIEEIYPPKSTEFSYVADGAFEVEDIHEFELFLIKELNWLLSPVTPNAWVQLYLQIAASKATQQARSEVPSPFNSSHRNSPCDLNISTNSGVSDLVACAKVIDLAGPGCVNARSSDTDRYDSLDQFPVAVDYDTDSADEEDEKQECRRRRDELNIVYPMYSPHVYVQVTRLMDLVMLDSHSLQFKYSILAAAAVYHATDIADVCQVTSLTWDELRPCVNWMKLHKSIIDSYQPLAAQIRTFENVSESDAHKIQYHSITKEMWDEALKCSENYFRPQSSLDMLAEVVQQETKLCSSPGPSGPNFITPPRSTRKVTPESGLRQ
ncbi:G1/S-specific cyclin-E-like [Littorina saxatilis]|uniref:Cyclin N-terminal domain-containing protein n=1 Tax=Littorina saxatilis TaxID=31220 RepID=A0AAN9BX08_9CAEN